jgi:hypothetical protein
LWDAPGIAAQTDAKIDEAMGADMQQRSDA